MFLPFRRITNRGAVVAVIACGLLSVAYHRLEEMEDKKRALQGPRIDSEWNKINNNKNTRT
jgi:hypothetical protein